jgi:hypothetical protein
VVRACPTTGQSFNSGFRAAPDVTKLIHAGKKLRLLYCRICNKIHEADFAAVGICEGSNFCRERKDCQSCPFAIHYV